MGWTSQDNLIDDISNNGQIGNQQFFKTTGVAGVGGYWTDLAVSAGFPVADTYAGASLTFVATDDTSTGAIYHGGNVSTATKHFLNCGASITAAAGAPWFLMCVDQLGYVPITGADVTSTTSRTITMTELGASARYPYGAGCRAYFSTEVAPTLGGPNLTTFTYQNQTGAGSSTCPVTMSNVAAPVAGLVPHSGPVASRYAPFIPLAAGDSGINDLINFTFSGGTAYGGTGQLVLHLVKPLFIIPIVATGMYTERDFLNQLPSLPKIPDGAYLKFLLFQTGATTTAANVLVNFDYAWG